MDEDDSIDDAIVVVTAFYGVSSEDVRSTRRSRYVHQARCVGMYLAYKAGANVEEIGRRFGNRDHRIVADVCRAMASQVASDYRQAQLFADFQKVCERAAFRRKATKPRTLS